MITVGSLFSGIGGIDYAFSQAGFEIAFQVEIDDFCRQVLAKHFPAAARHADIYDCHHLPHVDVLTAGFPCQPFSLAGKRLGEQDERYLIPEMFRIIREVQPHVCVFENVPGFASITDGATFRDFLRALAEIGFNAEWTHLRASDAGAPHQRERWFCVAYRAGSDGQYERSNVIREAPFGSLDISRTKELAYAYQSERQTRRAVASRARHASRRDVTPVGNAKFSRRGRVTRRRAKSQLANRYAWHGRQPQSSVGRDVDGLSARLDGHQFPAPPGCAQYPAEPPRVTTNAQDRAKRLKALGNAVVPQVVYPIALAIREWFEAKTALDAA